MKTYIRYKTQIQVSQQLLMIVNGVQNAQALWCYSGSNMWDHEL